MEGFKHLYSFICEDVRQEVNGKMMFLGQMDNLLFEKLPGLIPKVCIVYSVIAPKGSYRVSLKIHEEATGKQLLSIPEHSIVVKDDDHKLREVFQLHNLKIEQTGKYVVELFYNGEKVHSFFFNVTQHKPHHRRGPGVHTIPVNLSKN